jgi:hypothetical protein
MGFGPYGIIFDCVVTVVALVMLLRDSGSYLRLCAFTNLDFTVIIDGKFTSYVHIIHMVPVVKRKINKYMK